MGSQARASGTQSPHNPRRAPDADVHSECNALAPARATPLCRGNAPPSYPRPPHSRMKHVVHNAIGAPHCLDAPAHTESNGKVPASPQNTSQPIPCIATNMCARKTCSDIGLGGAPAEKPPPSPARYNSPMPQEEEYGQRGTHTRPMATRRCTAAAERPSCANPPRTCALCPLTFRFYRRTGCEQDETINVRCIREAVGDLGGPSQE